MSQEPETVSRAEAQEQVRKVCTRLALLHIAFARTLIKELGEEKGEQVIMKAIKEYGALIGGEVKARAARRGQSNAPSNYVEDLPLYGMYDSVETSGTGPGKRMKIRGCVMGQVWNELGEARLGRLYCYIDAAKYMAFNPDYKLVHEQALTEGDGCCELVLRPTTPEDKQAFAAEDTDWSRIDE
jgi:hypothetical protein